MSLTVLVTGCQSPLLRDSFSWKRDAASGNQVADNKAALPPPANSTANSRPAFNNPAVAQQQPPVANAALDSELAKGNAALANKVPTQAMKHFESALKLDPSNAVAHHMLAQISDQKQEFEAAEKHYLAALSAQPDNVSILCNLGWSYALQDRPQEAQQYLRRALSYDPDHQKSHMNLASVAVDMGDPAEAMFHIRKVANNEEVAGQLYAKELNRKSDKLSKLAKKAPTSTPAMAGKSYTEAQELMQIANEKQHSLQSAADRARLELQQFERMRREQILASGGQAQALGSGFAAISQQDMNREMSRLDQEQADQYREQRRQGVQRSNAPLIVGPEIASEYGPGQQLPPNTGMSGYQAQPSNGGGPNAWANVPNQGLPPIPGAPVPNSVTGQFAANQYVAPGFDPNGLAANSFAAGPNMNPNQFAAGNYQPPVPIQPPANWQWQQFGQQAGQPSGPPSNNPGNGFVAAPYAGQMQQMPQSGSPNSGAMANLPAMAQPNGNLQPSIPSQSSSGAWAPGQSYGPAGPLNNRQAGFQQAPAQSSVDPARQAMQLGMDVGPGGLFQFPSGTGYEAQRPVYQGASAPAPQVQQFPSNGPANMAPQGFGPPPQFSNQPGSMSPMMPPDANRYGPTPNWQYQGTMAPANGVRMQ